MLPATPRYLFIKFSAKENLKRTANRIVSAKPNKPVRSARSEIHAPPEARYTPRSEGDVRSARRETYAPLGGRHTPRPKRDARSARREKCTPLGGRRTLRPKRDARSASVPAFYSFFGSKQKLKKSCAISKLSSSRMMLIMKAR